VSGDAAAAAAGGLSTDAIGCTSVGVRAATLMVNLNHDGVAAPLRL